MMDRPGRLDVATHHQQFFFHSDAFVFRNNPGNIVSFLSDDTHQSVRIFFTKNADEIYSLGQSPFGGFIFSRTNAEILSKLITQIEDWCLATGVSKISIRLHPDIYDQTQSSFVARVLHNAGFAISLQEQLQVISIDAQTSERFNRNRNRKLKDCLDAGLIFTQLTPKHLEAAYRIFVECRENKNYPVTMSLDDFRICFKNFPEQYLLFGVMDGGELLAASVCVIVNDSILYDFFHGDVLDKRRLSPLTLLVKGLVDFCGARNFQLLDLGVSTDPNGVNVGLARFKTSFGASTHLKLTFSKTITRQ